MRDEPMGLAESGICSSRGLRSILYVPLSGESSSVGAFIVASVGNTRECGKTDIDLCRTLAHQISLAVMRTHPQKARELLAGIDFLVPALDIPYCHHEKWDGTGYPQGLVGDDIPLAARIFAVVDVYDALTSNRPYREGWAHERALEYVL